MTSLVEFMASGTIGPVRLGLSQSEVTRFWGEAPDVSRGRPRIVRYGPVEVTFIDGLVGLLAIYTRHRTHPGPLALDWDVDESTTAEALRRRIDELGLRYERVPALCFDTQEALRIADSGVVAIFDRNRLDSLQLSQ
jgi:hypothetical protein